MLQSPPVCVRRCTCASALAAGRAARFCFSQRGFSHPGSVLAGKVLVPNLNRLYNVADTGFVFFSLRFCKTFI